MIIWYLPPEDAPDGWPWITRPDIAGHLVFGEDGKPLPGLCHCSLDEAHYADPLAGNKPGFIPPPDLAGL